MKLNILAFLCLFSFQAIAQSQPSEDVEVLMEEEAFELPRVKIKEVKDLISVMGPENTCMDEYLKRRKQLIVKLSLSPVTIIAGTYGVSIAAGFVGLGIASALAFDELGGVVIGLALGFVGTGTATLTDTGIAAFQLADIDTLTKALGELHLNRPGIKSAKVYSRYIKGKESPMSEAAFYSALLELDSAGKLCDGSMVKAPRFGSGRRLKHKVARVKHLRTQI
jgi:hypothetical protein